MTHPNGDIYQGEWKDGKANGNGTFVRVEDQSVYDGEWINDEQTGKGTETWDNEQSVYTGDFVDGKKTGKGVFTKDGSKYTGDFVDGQFHGEGKYFNALTKRTFEGKFANNNFVSGKMLMADGSYYKGQYNKDLMNGDGTIYYVNGNAYVGSFENDQKQGMGYLFDFVNECKIREEYVKGERKNFVKSPSTKEEMTEQLKNQGYYFQSQKNSSGFKQGDHAKKGLANRTSVKSVTAVNRFKAAAATPIKTKI